MIWPFRDNSRVHQEPFGLPLKNKREYLLWKEVQYSYGTSGDWQKRFLDDNRYHNGKRQKGLARETRTYL